ncbi:MAG TPA: addiction module protein [Ignavibacteria bacterium]|nr:addiction module protein [Ignavibacteria bacterium]HMR39535.1 addiction module protein [Ignavibacteria bacterium]
MNISQINEILKLDIKDRINLVKIIWDSLADSSEKFELTENQKIELDERLNDYNENPEQGISWDELVGKLKNGK